MALNPDKGLGTRAGLLSVQMETKEFNKFVNKFVRECGVETETAIRRIALDLLSRIEKKNPVLTGRSRAGWFTSMTGLGGPWTEEGNDPEMIAKGKTEGKFVNKLKNKRVKYVVLINSVYYATILEYGSSSQSPAGMVRVSIREMTGKLPKEIADSYKKEWYKGKAMLVKNK
jgi:hypothetical protein